MGRPSHSTPFAAIKRALPLPTLLASLGIAVPEGGRSASPSSAPKICCFLPTHSEKTPSCAVYEDHFWCFGCGTGGDIFDAYQARMGADFGTTLRELAGRAGVELQLSDEDREYYERARRRHEVCKVAAATTEAAFQDPDVGAPARRFMEERGITAETATKCRIGYDPSWEGVRTAAVEQGVSVEQLQDAGLWVESKAEPGTFHDVLGKCVVFPFYEAGSVVFLKGRGVERKKHAALAGGDDRRPPVLYHPDGKLPRRGAVVVLVEGEADAVTVQQAAWALGLEAHVACIHGASTSPEDVADELKHTGSVVLFHDDDEAGRRSRDRLGLALGEKLRVGYLPYVVGDTRRGKDPNDLLQTLIREEGDADRGRTAFAELLQAGVRDARPYIDALVEEVAAEARDQVARVDLARARVVPVLAAMSTTARAAVLAGVAKKLKLQQGTIKAEVTAYLGRQRNRGEEESEGEAAARNLAELTGQLERIVTPLFYVRNGTVKLSLWSKTRRESFEVQTARRADIVAALAADTGDIISWVCDRVPTIEPSKVEDYVYRAVQAWTGRVPPRTGFTEVGEGVQSLPSGRVLIIDGQAQFLRERDGSMAPIDHPVVDDTHYVNPHTTGRPWLKWSLEHLQAPLVYTPARVVDLLEEQLQKAWRWKNEVDATFHALMPMALVLSTLWRRKPLVHVAAPTRSGKSRLTTGFYSGQIKGMPGWLPTAFLASDLSSAGAVGRLGNTALTLIVDEFESDEAQKRITEVLRLIRSAMLGAGGTLRGTQTGGWREQSLDVAMLTSAIQLFDKQADANRFLVTELAHADNVKPPEQVVRDLIRQHGVDPQEMRRTVVMGLLDHLEALQDAYDELAEHETVSAIEARHIENFLPVCAVAKVVGRDAVALLQRLVAAHQIDREETEAESDDKRLMRTLLWTPFSVSTSNGREDISIGELLKEARTTTVDLKKYGIWTSGDPKADRELLHVNFTAIKGAVLRMTPFADWSEKRLVRVARETPGCQKDDQTRACVRREDGKGYARPRLVTFNVQELLAGLGSYDPGPAPDEEWSEGQAR